MNEERELTQEELEAQQGAALPPREVMSVVSQNPGLILVPEDPSIVPIDDPEPI